MRREELLRLGLQMYFSLPLTGLVSLLGGLITYNIIPRFREMFVKVSWGFLYLYLVHGSLNPFPRPDSLGLT
jgi:hypothetical protein